MKIFKRINSLDSSCLLAAFIFITICSKSSFLYPLNDWGDTNAYFTVAKGVLNGMVPYRDLVEQKGPIIFFVYAIAVMISSTSYFGVYLLEVICAYIFLRICLAILDLYIDITQYCYIVTFIISGVVYSSYNFCHGGSVEELYLCIFAYAIYLFLRYVEKSILPNSLEMLIWGLMAGVLFFTKFSLCIIYICAILCLVFHSIVEGELLKLFRRSLYFILGCIIVSVLVILYFGMNQSLDEMFKYYFYNSTFNYLQSDKEVRKIALSEIYKIVTAKRNLFFLTGLVISLIWLTIKKKYYILFFELLSMTSYIYLHYVVAMPRKYYALPLSIYGIFAICLLIEIIESKGIIISQLLKTSTYVFMIIYAVVVTDNNYMMLQSRDSRVQTIYADEMKSYGYKDFHMLYFGKLDEGFYQASGKLPNCRVFITTNFHGDELKNAQKQYISDRKIEFIVTESILCDSKEYDKVLNECESEYKNNIVPLDNFAYELIDERELYYEYFNRPIRLYKIKNE